MICLSGHFVIPFQAFAIFLPKNAIAKWNLVGSSNADHAGENHSFSVFIAALTRSLAEAQQMGRTGHGVQPVSEMALELRTVQRKVEQELGKNGVVENWVMQRDALGYRG